MYKQWCLSLVFATMLAAAPVRAQDFTQPSASPAYTGISSSPHTGGILPSSLFDPKRFSISNSLVFGVSTGTNAYGNNGTAGLFTSSLGYKLSSNMMMRVNVGAHVNPAYGSSNETAKGVFVEGATFDWRPTGNSLLRVEYQNMRSPLQNPWGYGGYGPSYGYTPLGSGLAGDPMRN